MGTIGAAVLSSNTLIPSVRAAEKVVKTSSESQPLTASFPTGSMADALGFYDLPTPPEEAERGSNWILIAAPVVEEELNRVSCELFYTVNSGTPILIESGDIGYPFDGSTFLITGMQTGNSYIFTAKAEYDDATQQQRSLPISF
jgi:hypothetical protein